MKPISASTSRRKQLPTTFHFSTEFSGMIELSCKGLASCSPRMIAVKHPHSEVIQIQIQLMTSKRRKPRRASSPQWKLTWRRSTRIWRHSIPIWSTRKAAVNSRRLKRMSFKLTTCPVNTLKNLRSRSIRNLRPARSRKTCCSRYTIQSSESCTTQDSSTTKKSQSCVARKFLRPCKTVGQHRWRRTLPITISTNKIPLPSRSLGQTREQVFQHFQELDRWWGQDLAKSTVWKSRRSPTFCFSQSSSDTTIGPFSLTNSCPKMVTASFRKRKPNPATRGPSSPTTLQSTTEPPALNNNHHEHATRTWLCLLPTSSCPVFVTNVKMIKHAWCRSITSWWEGHSSMTLRPLRPAAPGTLTRKLRSI